MCCVWPQHANSCSWYVHVCKMGLYIHTRVGGRGMLHVHIWLFEHIQECVRVFMTVPACLCVFVFVFYLCICCISKHFDNTFSRDRVSVSKRRQKKVRAWSHKDSAQYVWCLFCFILTGKKEWTLLLLRVRLQPQQEIWRQN